MYYKLNLFNKVIYFTIKPYPCRMSCLVLIKTLNSIMILSTLSEYNEHNYGFYVFFLKYHNITVRSVSEGNINVVRNSRLIFLK